MMKVDWDEVLSAASRLQGIVRDAVLVGGTASAIWAGHRTSYDADHIVPDLRENFDRILEDLESVSGWKTARTIRTHSILGGLDGIETGIRQLIRAAPLETEEVTVRGNTIVVPTPYEIVRIKGALILTRNAARDYIDFAALTDSVQNNKAYEALRNFDTLYPQKNCQSALQQLIIQLGKPLPFDLQGTDLSHYRVYTRNGLHGKPLKRNVKILRTISCVMLTKKLR
jgi:hypothetical protein